MRGCQRTARANDRRRTNEQQFGWFPPLCFRPVCLTAASAPPPRQHNTTEFTQITLKTAMGFLIMGFIGFFVKLLFIVSRSRTVAVAAAACERARSLCCPPRARSLSLSLFRRHVDALSPSPLHINPFKPNSPSTRSSSGVEKREGGRLARSSPRPACRRHPAGVFLFSAAAAAGRALSILLPVSSSTVKSAIEPYTLIRPPARARNPIHASFARAPPLSKIKKRTQRRFRVTSSVAAAPKGHRAKG